MYHTALYPVAVRNLSDHLPALKVQYPNYEFAITHTWHGLSFVALRTGAGDGPYMLITSDVAELRKLLSGNHARK